MSFLLIPGLSEHIQFDLISVKFICTLLREDTDIKANDSIRDLLLQKMQIMNFPLATSKPRFSPHKLVAMPYRHCIYIRTVSSKLLLFGGIFVFFIADLGQKSSVLCMLLCPNSP